MAKRKKFAVGVAAFPKNDPPLAMKMKKKLIDQKIDGVQIIERRVFLEVVVAPFESRTQADAVVAILAENGVQGYISTLEPEEGQEEAKTEPEQGESDQATD